MQILNRPFLELYVKKSKEFVDVKVFIQLQLRFFLSKNDECKQLKIPNGSITYGNTILEIYKEREEGVKSR